MEKHEKICPMGKITVGSAPVVCARESCAWWKRYFNTRGQMTGCCSILQIARSMEFVGDMSEEISNQLAGPEEEETE